MAPYLIAFATCCFLLYLAENHKKNGEQIISSVLVIVALSVPSIVAGARDEGVGFDTKLYGAWLFNLACASDNLFTFVKDALSNDVHMEALFALQAYPVVKLTSSVFWYYFIIEMFIIVPIYFAIKEFKGNAPIWVTMGFYLTVFFLPGLNTMRQHVAMSFALLSFAKLYRRRYLSSLVLIVCAVLFHTSGIVGVAPHIIFLIFFKNRQQTWCLRRYAARIFPFCLVGILFIFAEWQSIIEWVTSSIGFFSKYSYAVSYNGSGELRRAYYLFYGVMLISFLIMSKRLDSHKRALAMFYACMVGLGLLVNTLETSSETLARLASYYLIYAVPLFAFVYVKPERIVDLHVFIAIGLVSVIAASVFFYAFKGNADVVPYASSMLGLY